MQNVPSFGSEIFVDLGSFDFSGTDLRSVADLTNTAPHTLAVGSPKTQLAGMDAGASSFLNQAENVTGSGFSFPIFDSPTDLFGLFLGKDVELISFDMAPLSLSLSKTFTLPVFPPLAADITGMPG